MYEGQQPPPPDPSRPTVDAAKLWSGGAATAVVTALIAVVGILIARGVLDIFILAPSEKGAWDAASAGPYAICAALGALAATALMHLSADDDPASHVCSSAGSCFWWPSWSACGRSRPERTWRIRSRLPSSTS